MRRARNAHKLTENQQIAVLGQRAMHSKAAVVFVIPLHKAEKFIVKLLASFPQLEVAHRANLGRVARVRLGVKTPA